MYKKLAHLLRNNVDQLSDRWTMTLHSYYPDNTIREVFRKVRATHLLLARALIEKNFSYLFHHLQTEFQEWILLKNSFRDLLNLEPVYAMLFDEFINHSDLEAADREELILLVEKLRASTIKDDLYEIYVGEQEKLFSRQIDELEVLNDVSGTDLVGEDTKDLDGDGLIEQATDPNTLLKITLERAMKVLGATDGVLAYNLDSGHEVVVSFADAPEERDLEYVKKDVFRDEEDAYDPTVLRAFSHVVDRAVLRNYWNPDLVEDLRSQNCPRCPFRDELVTSMRGSIECPIIQSLKVHTFFCHQLGQAGELGFFLLARNSPPSFSNEDKQFIETLASSMMTIIKNYQLYEKQVQLATTDGMTKLFNHRYFQEALSREISLAKRYSKTVSLLYMDIDHFKKFNDTYGHQVGDEVLIRVARTIMRNTRDTDIACRYGGEELVAILPETDLDGAFIAAEKIRKAIYAMSIPIEGNRSVKVAVSIGVATFAADNVAGALRSPRAVDKQTLIEAADNALYEAKEGGRNQTRKATRPKETKAEKNGEEKAVEETTEQVKSEA